MGEGRAVMKVNCGWTTRGKFTALEFALCLLPVDDIIIMMSLTPVLRPVIYLTGLVRKGSASSHLSVAPGDSGRNSEPLHSCGSCYSKTAHQLLYTLHIVCLSELWLGGLLYLSVFLKLVRYTCMHVYFHVHCMFVQG